MASSTDPETMESAVYLVRTGGTMPDFLYPDDEYEAAFQMATGLTIDEAGDDHPGEKHITIWDFDGEIEPPVANV